MFQGDGPRGPNIGDTIQNISDPNGRFRKVFRGGFRTILIIGLLALGGLWLSTGVYTVEAGEQAVVRQFGQFHSLWPVHLGIESNLRFLAWTASQFPGICRIQL